MNDTHGLVHINFTKCMKKLKVKTTDTLEHCERIGWSHAMHGEIRTFRQGWNEEQKSAYKRGYDDYMENGE